MDRLGGSAALESADERALIERHWSAPQRSGALCLNQRLTLLRQISVSPAV